MKNWNEFSFGKTLHRRWAVIGMTVGLALGTGAGFAADPATPLPERPAYVEMLKADRFREANQGDKALRAYRASLQLFLDLQREKPEYKTDIIGYRIAYCREQLANLAPGAAQAGTGANASGAVVNGPDWQVLKDQWEREKAVLEQDRDRLRKEVESLRAEILVVRTGLETAQIGEREQKDRADALAIRGDQLEAERKEWMETRVDREQMEALVRENRQLRKSAVEGEAALERMKVRQQQMLDSQAKLMEREVGARARLGEEMDTLRMENQALRQTARAAAESKVPSPVSVEVPSAPVAMDPIALTRMDEAIQAGRLDEAEGIVRGLLETDPEHAEARFGRVRLLLAQGETRAGRKELDRLAREFPAHGGIQHRAGTIRWDAGDVKGALKYLERAVQTLPSSVAYWRDLAVASYEAGRIQEAAAAFREVVRLAPEDGPAHFNLAALLLRDRKNETRTDEARSFYQRAMELGEARDEILERRLQER
ncbi:MAG: tetratricopeptide repeat protein, partial [Kiritimatiellia bacterium]|nr:tetratricopeptide repeat protein [Kiritimatiellia bacterium]